MKQKQQFTVLATAIRVLTFRAGREELIGLDHRHLAVGLLATWLVGMGRHWDAADATLVQSLGLVSIAFVLGLAGMVWMFGSWFGPANWSYRRVLTFLTLAAPPAALYAIPVERMIVPETAQQLNLTFLALVSVWRLSLLVFLLTRLGELSLVKATVIMPVSLLAAAFAVLTVIATFFGNPGPC